MAGAIKAQNADTVITAALRRNLFTTIPRFSTTAAHSLCTGIAKLRSHFSQRLADMPEQACTFSNASSSLGYFGTKF
jgi:hypothetical protein